MTKSVYICMLSLVIKRVFRNKVTEQFIFLVFFLFFFFFFNCQTTLPHVTALYQLLSKLLVAIIFRYLMPKLHSVLLMDVTAFLFRFLLLFLFLICFVFTQGSNARSVFSLREIHARLRERRSHQRVSIHIPYHLIMACSVFLMYRGCALKLKVSK